MKTWTTKSYAISDLKLTADDLNKNSFAIAFGLSSNSANYFVDNVKISSPGSISSEGILMVDDMENKSIGESYSTRGWSPGDAVATVSVDPANASNKVLNVITTNWNANALFDVLLPQNMTLGDFETISYALYNTNSGEWTQFKNTE